MRGAIKAGTIAFSLLLLPSENASARDPRIDNQYSETYNICMNTGAAAQGVQPAMNQCTADEYARQDKVLNAIYKQIITKLSVKNAIKLRKIQRKWIAARDIQCEKNRSEYEGGSIAPLIYFTCMADETIMRISWLEERYT